MNKKAYINPEIEVIKLQTLQMLADSVGKGSGEIGGGQIGAPGFDPEPEPNMFGF